MDCFFHEGIKVLYRVAMAILLLFYKYSTSQSSEWSAELAAQGVDNALTKFCRQMPVSIFCICNLDIYHTSVVLVYIPCTIQLFSNMVCSI